MCTTKGDFPKISVAAGASSCGCWHNSLSSPRKIIPSISARLISRIRVNWACIPMRLNHSLHVSFDIQIAYNRIVNTWAAGVSRSLAFLWFSRFLRNSILWWWIAGASIIGIIRFGWLGDPVSNLLNLESRLTTAITIAIRSKIKNALLSSTRSASRARIIVITFIIISILLEDLVQLG